MNIRPATVADMPRIFAIERNTSSAAHWSKAEYANLFSEGSRRLCLASEDDGELEGFLVAHAAGPEWELENIVVREDSRQRGVGSALISELIAEARQRNAEAILLEVRESNTAARCLYRKCGFVETGRRKAYYSDPREDAILYTLRGSSLSLVPQSG